MPRNNSASLIESTCVCRLDAMLNGRVNALLVVQGSSQDCLLRQMVESARASARVRLVLGSKANRSPKKLLFLRVYVS